MVTIDSKLETIEHSLLDRMEDKAMTLTQITYVLEALERVTIIRERNLCINKAR